MGIIWLNTAEQQLSHLGRRSGALKLSLPQLLTFTNTLSSNVRPAAYKFWPHIERQGKPFITYVYSLNAKKTHGNKCI